MSKKLLTILGAVFLYSSVYAEKIVREFDVEGRPSLTLSNIAGDIIVRQGNNSEVIIHADNPNPEVEVIFRQSGNKITVETKYPRNANNIKKGVFFEVWLPRMSDAELNTVSGDIELSEIEGRLSLNSVSGDAIVSDSAGDLELNSVSGDIKVNRLGISNLDANAVSGDIELSDLNLESGHFEFNSVSGDIEIWYLDSASFTISGQTLSGSIHANDMDGIKVKKEKYSGMRSLSGSYNGTNADIDVNSVSGDISLGIK